MVNTEVPVSASQANIVDESTMSFGATSKIDQYTDIQSNFTYLNDHKLNKNGAAQELMWSKVLVKEFKRLKQLEMSDLNNLDVAYSITLKELLKHFINKDLRKWK